MPSSCGLCGARLRTRKDGSPRCPACDPPAPSRASQAPQTPGHAESCDCFRCHHGERAYGNWRRSGFTSEPEHRGPERPGQEDRRVPVDAYGRALDGDEESGVSQGTVLDAHARRARELYEGARDLAESLEEVERRLQAEALVQEARSILRRV